MARRDRWTDRAFEGAIHGIKPDPEPDWGINDGSSGKPSVTPQHEADFEAMKARYREKNRLPDGRKFPGTL